METRVIFFRIENNNTLLIFNTFFCSSAIGGGGGDRGRTVKRPPPRLNGLSMVSCFTDATFNIVKFKRKVF